MNNKAIARNIAILIAIIIILVASVIGVVWYFTTLPEEAPPLPGEFELSNLTISPSSITVGGSVTISVDVKNTGETEVTGPVTLALNDKVEEWKDVTVAANETETVTFTVTKDVGIHEVTIPGTTLTGTFTVTGGVPAFVENKELIYESGNTYQWMDPHVSYYAYDYWTLWHSVEMLLWFERENATKIIPWLAESYTRSDDGLQYNFTLRQGITFQDGTTFNATAVWFSLNRLFIMDATSGDPVATATHGSQAGWMVQQLVDPDGLLFTAMGAAPSYDASWVNDVLALNFVEIIDEYTVSINLAVPTTQFLAIMAGPWAGIVSPTETIAKDYEYGGWGTWDGNYTSYFINRAGDGDTYFNVPEDGWTFGTGAYYVESVSATTYRIVLKAYDDYWGGPNNINLPPAGKERIETIEYRYQSSFTTRLLNLKAGTVTAIQVPEVNIFSVVDEDKWLEDAELVSIIPDVTVHGVFPTFNTWWLDFCTNITNPDGSFREWQPFADRRLRLAAASAVNMTYANININYRLSVLANNIIPPGTAPEGSHNADIKPVFSFDMDLANQSIIDAYENPLNSTDYDMYYYNGTKIPAGVVDNAFSKDNPKSIKLYVQTGAETFIKVLTTMADNLNTLSRKTYGLTWEVVLVPGGQQYTLAQRHQIDSYMGGWIADYNNVLNWMQPMYYSRGAYPSWNLWNITALDDLYWQAVAADEAGNTTELLRINDEMNTLANELLMYMVWWHDTEYFTRSSWLQGWYHNANFGNNDLWSAMYYEEPSVP
jgi:ABC-type transport system substrate-binding protein